MEVQKRTTGNNKKAKKNYSLKSNENIAGYLFALPVILGLLVFTVIPMIASLFLSFTDYNVISDFKMIGFENYKKIFTEDLYFKKSIYVTFIFVIGNTFFTMIAAIIMALLMNVKIKGQGIFRTIIYLPVVLPAVASNILWMWMYNPDFGLLNTILKFFHLPTSNWIYDEKTAIPSIFLMSVWACGGTALIILAGLQDVPTDQLEAVEVDGGNVWHKFAYITIPFISPIIFFNIVMGFIGAFQTFSQAYIMTGGGPNNATLFYALLIYRKAFGENQFGYASALAWIMFIIIAFFTMFIFKTAKSWVFYGGEE